MDTTEKYRFETGSLYEYSPEDHSYIHCWKDYRHNTKAKAIKAYEESEDQSFLEQSS